MAADAIRKEAGPLRAGTPTPSRQVAWFETFRFAERFAAHHGLTFDHHLIAGTPQWVDLPDDDARKLLALILGGVREALDHDAAQEQSIAAAGEIRCATDWSAIARRIQHGRGDAYIQRKGAA